MNIRLTREQKTKVLNSYDVYKIMQQILLRESKIHRNREHFWLIGLNNKHSILFIELLALGADNKVSVKPIDLFRMCVYKLASKVIFVHNHPSGIVKPSETDIDYTDFLMKTGELLGLQVIDHLIITEDSFMSFEEVGIINNLKDSKAYRVVDKYYANNEKSKLKSAERKGKKDLAMDIAKKMLQKGDSISLVRDYTKLSIKDVNKAIKDLDNETETKNNGRNNKKF